MSWAAGPLGCFAQGISPAKYLPRSRRASALPRGYKFVDKLLREIDGEVTGLDVMRWWKLCGNMMEYVFFY